jgi:hypothetical protein
VKDGRWVTIAESQFAHEKQGLEIVKALLPDASPFRAWANFEFRDNRGRWHEVDLLVLARDTLYLIELKHYRGILRGNDHVWMREGHRPEDSPLLLTRRKAQYFSSLLKDTQRQLGDQASKRPSTMRRHSTTPPAERSCLRRAPCNENLVGPIGKGRKSLHY